MSWIGAYVVEAIFFPTRKGYHPTPAHLHLTLEIAGGIFAIWTVANILVPMAGGVKGGLEHAIVVEPDGVTLVSPGVREFIAWDSVKDFKRSDAGLSISTKASATHVIPGSAFRGVQDRDAFLQAANAVRNGFGMSTPQTDAPAWPPPPGSQQ